jgi:hypothetical protein
MSWSVCTTIGQAAVAPSARSLAASAPVRDHPRGTGEAIITFTDEEMGQLLPTAKTYSVVILKQGPKFGDDVTPGIVWEHGRRNFGLRDDGVLAVVLPVTDGSDVCGIGVFAATVDETTAIMGDDPGVAAGVFTYEVHSCRGFPGDSLP